ncbi:MAG: hypothetical protein ACOCYW_04835 [Roseicyclus sp.]
MYLTADKVTNALLKAQHVLARPEIFAGDIRLIPISIDQLKDTVAEMSGYEIIARHVSFDGSYILGRCEKWDNKKAIIDIKYDLAEDWARFVTAKELLHLIIDSEEDMSPYGDEILEKLVQEGHIGVISKNGDKPAAQSELVAEVAAIELLYPIQLRLQDYAERDRRPLNMRKLALRYGIPVNFIETAFSAGYLGTIREAAREHLQM